MKKITICLLVLSFLIAGIHGYMQDTVNPQADSVRNKIIMRSCYSHLRGARTFNTVINCFEIAGASLFSVGLAKEIGGLEAAGFLVGFGGMEMSKATPVPLTKARRELVMLHTSWKDTLEYNRIYHQVRTAESLSYAAMALVFSGEVLVGLSALFSDHSSIDFQTAILTMGVVCIGVSFGTSVGTTIMTGKAKTGFKKHFGSIGLGIGHQGIGAVYTLP
jgi:hypothetical protein